MISSREKGDHLEDQVFYLFNKLIEQDRFWAKRECCKLYKKRKYFSKDRESYITFDIALEIFIPGQDSYSQLAIIECKNYNHPVKVDDLEEFFAKVQQVAAANSKAIFVSNNSFQKAARAYAKSKGIGLARYLSPEELKWELQRSPSAGSSSNTGLTLEIETGLAKENYHSRVFDFFMETEHRLTASIWDFCDDVFSSVENFSVIQSRICNKRTKLEPLVPYVEKEDLEYLASDILYGLKYNGGVVDLDAACKSIAGLSVQLRAPLPSHPNLLGRVEFDILVITIFPSSDTARNRFTLAHELAHVILKHGQYIAFDSCEESDIASLRNNLPLPKDIKRMEFQANFLASCLMMPKKNFELDFFRIIKSINIQDKGFGHLYLDDQPCNLRDYLYVVTKLASLYGTSKTATHIRLQTLGLLNDVREQSDNFFKLDPLLGSD